MTQQAYGFNRQLAVVDEAPGAYGVEPTSPQTRLVEFVTFTPKLNAAELTSKSVNQYRQVLNLDRGNTNTTANMVLEANPTNFDWAFQSVLGALYDVNGKLIFGGALPSFTAEERFTDTGWFRSVSGLMFDTLTFKADTTGYFELTATLIGKAMGQFVTTTICSTPTAFAKEGKFFHSGMTFKEGGTTVGFVSSVELTIANKLSPNYTLGNTSMHSVGLADLIDVKFKYAGLFEDKTQANKFSTNAASSIDLAFGNGAENRGISVPSMKYSAFDISEGSSGCEVSAEGTAFLDLGGAEGSSLVVTKS